MVEKKTALPQPRIRDAALRVVNLPTKGASLMTGPPELPELTEP